MTARLNEAVGELAPLLACSRAERPEGERLPYLGPAEATHLANQG